MGLFRCLFHQVVDGFDTEGEPLALHRGHAASQGFGSGSEDGGGPPGCREALAAILLKGFPAVFREVAHQAAVIVSATVQDYAVQILVGC